MMLLLVFLALFALVGVYLRLIRPLGYWKRRGVLYTSGWSPLLNLITQKKSFFDFAIEAYKAFPNERLVTYPEIRLGGGVIGTNNIRLK